MGLTQLGTDGIKDDAITLAKQAAGTDGQVITYDASGNPKAIGPGTDGQVLTSAGAGAEPAFENIAIADNSITGAKIALGSDASGDIMYNNGTDYVRLAKGTDDQVLTLASGVPSWAAAGGGLFSKAWYDSDATETTITGSSGETRVGGNSGSDLEVVWTPPSTSTKYVYLCYLHFRFSLGGQWGWQPEFTSNNWTSKTGIGNHPSFSNEYPNEVLRSGLVQVGHFHPNTTSECKMGLFATVWSSHSASIVLNGSLQKSRIFLYEVADPQSNFSGI